MNSLSPFTRSILTTIVPVCYCFGYTPPKIREEGKIASQTIAAEVKAGHCACEVKNPKGVCCLGDVARVERLMAVELVGADR